MDEILCNDRSYIAETSVMTQSSPVQVLHRTEKIYKR